MALKRHAQVLRAGTLLFAVLLGASGMSVWYSLQQIDRLHAYAERVEHTRGVLRSATGLLSLVKDAETGQRGFVLTGEESYLEPYRTAAREAIPALDRLGALVADNERQVAQVGRLRDLLELKLLELDATIRARRQGGMDAALAIIRTDGGKQAMDDIRGVFTEIEAEEDQRLNEGAALIGPAERKLKVDTMARTLALIALAGATWGLLTSLARRSVEVARSRNLITTTLASIGDGVIVTDAQGVVTFLNAEAERLTGWDRAEAAGRHVVDVFNIVNESTRLSVENPIEKVLRSGKIAGLGNHTILISRRGVEVPIDDSAAPIRERSGEAPEGPILGVVLCFRDFSQHKKLERELMDYQRTLEARVTQRTEELTRAHERARLADRMATVGTMAAGLAHDLSNLLVPLSMQLDSALSAPGMSAECRADFDGVKTLVGELREVAKTLSLFARDPERGEAQGRTDLAAWRDRVKGLMEMSISGGPCGPCAWIRINWEIPDGLPVVRAAPHRLTRAILNLVQNARDAIVEARKADRGGESAWGGGRRGRILVRARHDAAGAAVVIDVIDDGCGMDEATRHRCTEAFFTTKQGVDGTIGGSGLGLALVQSIALRAGGHVEIETNLGKGTRVSITFPTDSAGAAPGGDSHEASAMA